MARAAVEKLVAHLGPDARFPFDKVWEYADQVVPSTQRPHQARRLISAGFLEPTGGFTNAATTKRAGAPTREYRPGPKFRDGVLRFVAQADDGAHTVADALTHLAAILESHGMIITPQEIANYYLALLSSPLVILGGQSGTGKSWLPRLFTQAIRGRFIPIRVKPQWSDNADLFGYMPAFAPDRFIEGPFTSAIKEAGQIPNVLTTVLLDEMNLAAVEHYFSDFLSVVESRRRESGRIITDPLPLELPAAPDELPDPYKSLRCLALPPNVRVVGTANMDETTRPFSPKVIDRAFNVEFNDVDLTAFTTQGGIEVNESLLQVLSDRLTSESNPVAIREVYNEQEEFFDGLALLLEQIRTIVHRAGVSFAYRTRDAILLYMWHWKYDGLARILTLNGAFDLCISQKILPKITGTGEVLRQALEDLLAWLTNADGSLNTADREAPSMSPRGPYTRSAAKVERMLARLEEEGATTFWDL